MLFRPGISLLAKQIQTPSIFSVVDLTFLSEGKKRSIARPHFVNICRAIAALTANSKNIHFTLRTNIQLLFFGRNVFALNGSLLSAIARDAKIRRRRSVKYTFTFLRSCWEKRANGARLRTNIYTCVGESAGKTGVKLPRSRRLPTPEVTLQIHIYGRVILIIMTSDARANSRHTSAPSFDKQIWGEETFLFYLTTI